MNTQEKIESRNLAKTKTFIEVVEKKITYNQSIAEELEILKILYNYVSQKKEDENPTKSLIESVLPKFEDYQNGKEAETIKLRKEKRIAKIKKNKIAEYKSLWKEKSIIYKLVHPSKNPERVYFDKMDYIEIEEKANKLQGRQK